jgi:hypothetical protein
MSVVELKQADVRYAEVVALDRVETTRATPLPTWSYLTAKVGVGPGSSFRSVICPRCWPTSPCGYPPTTSASSPGGTSRPQPTLSRCSRPQGTLGAFA